MNATAVRSKKGGIEWCTWSTNYECACAHVRMCACAHVRMCACACARACVHVRVYVHMCSKKGGIEWCTQASEVGKQVEAKWNSSAVRCFQVGQSAVTLSQ